MNLDPTALVHVGLTKSPQHDGAGLRYATGHLKAPDVATTTPLCGSLKGATTPYTESVTCPACKETLWRAL